MVDDKVLGGGWEKNFEEFWQGMLHCPVDETRTKFIIQVMGPPPDHSKGGENLPGQH